MAVRLLLAVQRSTRQWWTAELAGHAVQLLDQRVGERDALDEPTGATLRFQLSRHRDSVVSGREVRRVHVVDEAIDVGAERVERQEAGDIEHHEAGALRDAVPPGELGFAV